MNLSKTYLVTGGSGFLGVELIKRLVEQGFNLRTVARNEGQLINLKEQFPTVEILTGDISDDFTAKKACVGVAGVFHLAAYKHVGLAEDNVKQCVDSNVIGTLNILQHSQHCDFVIGISTDKAAQVKGIYGATKLIQEGLFREYEKVNRETKYRTVRYGNVLYSTGSVLCKWKDKLPRGEEIIITDPEATRFYWTVEQAVDLIFDCLNNAKDSTPHHFPMKAIRMADLLECMMEKYGQAPVKVIGLQKGENMHEIIVDNGTDSSSAPRYSKEEIMQLI